MSDIKRNPDGTFPKGVSGNRLGRPRKRPVNHRVPAANRRVAFEVAEMPVELTMDSGKLKVSAYRAVMLALAKKAMAGHNPSIRLFLSEMRAAASINGDATELNQYFFDEMRKLEAELDHLNGLLPKATNSGVYVMQSDVCRAVTKQATGASAMC